MSSGGSQFFDQFATAVGRRCSIDLRGLAVFRMAIGVILLVDLLGRSRNLVMFYTDSGVLPRRALASDYSGAYSIHTLSGDAWFQGLLFVIAAVFALMLLVGYRTRIATLVSWLLLLSLQARNPMVLHSGDHLLGLLLFWSLFLPLGERWSIDADRIDRDRLTVTSIAALALLLQVLLVYVTNAIYKSRGEPWMNGEALPMVYQADHYTILLGDYLASYPELLEWLTVTWGWLLFLSPLLLLLTGARRTMLTTIFVGAHLGMALSINVSIFPFVSIAALLVYYPPSLWDALAALLSRVGIPDRARAARTRLPTPGLVFTPPANVRSGLSWARVQFGRGRGIVSLVVPYLFLTLILTSGAASVGYTSVPDAGEQVLEATETGQSWSMFAPDPLRTTRWYAAPGQLENGDRVDTLHESNVIFEPGSTDAASGIADDAFKRPENIEGTYRSARFRKYLMNVQFTENENHRSYLTNYLCDRWNRQHEITVESVSIWGMSEQTHPYNGTVQFDREYQLIEYDCSGPFVQE